MSVLRIGTMWEGRDFSDGHDIKAVTQKALNSSHFLPLVFRTGHGERAIWVLAAINPDYLLSRMDRYHQHSSDWFELARFDGHFLMSTQDELKDSQFSLLEQLPEVQHKEIGTHIDRWLTAYRSSSRYPLIVAVHVDREVVLNQWAEHFGNMIFWTMAALCAVIGISIILMRQVQLSEKKERAQQQELALARDKAEAATLAKSQFLATMSHEIRTPMNGVLGMTQLALEQPLPKLVERYIRSAHGAAHSLLRILNDILDFSKIEAGKLEIESIRFNLTDLLHDVVTIQQLMAEDSALSLELDVAPATPAWIQSDPLRISQILNNLLSNAMKFTPSGRVILRVFEASKNVLHMEVQDQGLGMTQEQKNKLFQPFQQADKSTARLYGGTGLGLSICKQLCDQMGGHISVESQLGLGSTFSVDLPFETVDVQETDLNSLETVPLHIVGGYNFSGLRVLIVDDHERDRQLMVALLTNVNLEVAVAHQGKDALELLTNTTLPFDLILMNIQMSVKVGINTAQIIRSDSQYNSLPIIAIMTEALADEKCRCLDVGIQDCLIKPLNNESLYKCIAKWVL